MKTGRFSLLACLLFGIVQVYMQGWYHPEHHKESAPSVIVYDVAGYYQYLPACFIYNDLTGLSFKSDIKARYYKWSNFYTDFEHASGARVMKYSCGLAVLYSPFFLIAHVLAEPLGFPADGYSLPYHVAIYWGCSLYVFLALLLLRAVIIKYYSDIITALTLLALGLGTNLLMYATFKSTESHGPLFFLVSSVIYLSDRFYKTPSYWSALGIGVCVGLAALSRPTEILIALIPLLWGIGSIGDLSERVACIKSNWMKYALAVCICMAVGSLQLIYWKYATGDWIVYSYEDQGFSWLNPHIMDGLISAEKGWLVWTPMMIIALIGFIFLRKKERDLFPFIFCYFLLHAYITWSWDVWMYGGAFGQRAMVQIYPLLAFPMAACIDECLNRKWLITGIGGLLIVLFGYFNIWLTHQAINGGLASTEYHTKAYWKAILFKSKEDVPWDVRKLLDVPYAHRKTISDSLIIASETFESNYGIATCGSRPALYGEQSFCLYAANAKTPVLSATVSSMSGYKAIRARATIEMINKEWNIWDGQRMIVRLLHNGKEVRRYNQLVSRVFKSNQRAEFILDIKIRNEYDQIEFYIDHVKAENTLIIDNMQLIAFNP